VAQKLSESVKICRSYEDKFTAMLLQTMVHSVHNRHSHATLSAQYQRMSDSFKSFEQT